MCRMASSTSPWITVDERERTHALPGEILYPLTSSAASSPSTGASIGAPQVTPLCEFPSITLFFSLYISLVYVIVHVF